MHNITHISLQNKNTITIVSTPLTLLQNINNQAINRINMTAELPFAAGEKSLTSKYLTSNLSIKH
jgi:hypothetical protein